MEIIKAIENWWHAQSTLELIGVATGLLCVYLAAINNIWNWPFAIISTAIYIYIFEQTALYADMGQNIYLLCINIYGWCYWVKKPKGETKRPVLSITKKQIVWSVIVVAIATPVLGYTLITLSPILNYRPAAFPYLDSFCTACSLVGQLFLARKILENWLIWIFVDVIYVGIYIVKDLRPTAFMFGVYVLIALFGYLDWRKEYCKQLKPVNE
jgi:nicotinamide mononucleotide transporter